MSYSPDVKKLAYDIDPPCWVSYSGKSRRFKQVMDARREESLKQAEGIITRRQEVDLYTLAVPALSILQDKGEGDLRDRFEDLCDDDRRAIILWLESITDDDE